MLPGWTPVHVIWNNRERHRSLMRLWTYSGEPDTTMRSISYCKAVSGGGQTQANGKGHGEGRSQNPTWSSTVTAVSSNIWCRERLISEKIFWWWLTRPRPGHKLLFGQAYLLWGVNGEGRLYQNVGSYQMTRRAKGVVFSFLWSCTPSCLCRQAEARSMWC